MSELHILDMTFKNNSNLSYDIERLWNSLEDKNI